MSARACCNAPARQDGQALIFGVFTLVGGLVALFFLFNTGQLTAEKTKLVNTADAVAYSAGVMHARALNFDAYTNRSLIANEVMIAQAVSIASWTAYVARHSESAAGRMQCASGLSVPARLLLAEYTLPCYSLGIMSGFIEPIAPTVQQGVQAVVTAAEAAKAVLQAAQVNMAADLFLARRTLMQEVADVNYSNDGEVKVDNIPLTDDFGLNGSNFITRYSDNDRSRFKEVTVEAAKRDQFIEKRSWTSSNSLPCGLSAEFRRRGGTEMIGLDEWRAMDTASLHTWSLNFHFPWFSCDEDEDPLGYGGQGAGDGGGGNSGFGGSTSDNPTASAYTSSSTWNYSGLPKFFDLQKSSLQASVDSPPVLRFSIRLTRGKDQARTSEGRSSVKPTGNLAKFDTHLSSDLLAAVATSEVFFRRPASRGDSKSELASLFNPFWQVHLVSTSSADIAKAIAFGGAK